MGLSNKMAKPRGGMCAIVSLNGGQNAMKEKVKRLEQSRKRGRPPGGKYEETVYLDASPSDVARSMFNSKPKPKGEWRYLRKKA